MTLGIIAPNYFKYFFCIFELILIDLGSYLFLTSARAAELDNKLENAEEEKYRSKDTWEKDI